MELSKKEKQTIEAMEWSLASDADKEAQILRAMEWTPRSDASMNYNELPAWLGTTRKIVSDSFYAILGIIVAIICLPLIIVYLLSHHILGFIIMKLEASMLSAVTKQDPLL